MVMTVKHLFHIQMYDLITFNSLTRKNSSDSYAIDSSETFSKRNLYFKFIILNYLNEVLLRFEIMCRRVPFNPLFSGALFFFIWNVLSWFKPVCTGGAQGWQNLKQ